MAKGWYIVHTYTGYENKIERTIRTKLEEGEIDSSVISDVKVPVEELIEIKDGKKRSRKNKFLPGYIMLEMDLPDIGWKAICSAIRSIQGVTGFVGTNPNQRPRPISNDEARNILMKSGDIKGEKSVRIKLTSSVIRLKSTKDHSLHSVVLLRKSIRIRASFALWFRFSAVQHQLKLTSHKLKN